MATRTTPAHQTRQREHLEEQVENRTRELRRANQQLESLYRVGKTITAALHLDVVLNTIARSSAELLDTDVGVILLIDPATQTLTIKGAYGVSEFAVTRTRDRLGESIAGRVALTGQPIIANDLPNNPLFFNPAAGGEGLLACASVPLLVGTNVIGTLDVHSKRDRFAFGEQHIHVLQMLASQAAIAIENARLYTELREARDELERTVDELKIVNVELEEANRHKTEFLASMSHELRTPLNAIIGFSELLLDHSSQVIPEDMRQTYVQHIHRGGEHLLGLINDMLDVSKVEAGRLQLHCEPVRLLELIEGCAAMLRVAADTKHISVELSCEPSNLVVLADPSRLKQIMYNLLSNALKFTADGGHVSVSATTRPGEVLIAVADTGIGIRPEDHASVFEAFWQPDLGSGGVSEGTGLGLHVVRTLLELHGGKIWLESTPGEGSCFTFSLPY